MAGIIPRRGTPAAGTRLQLEKVTQYAIINTHASLGMYIRNEVTDTDANSTYLPPGASFSSPENSAYYQDGYTKIIFDATGGATFTYEAMSQEPTVV